MDKLQLNTLVLQAQQGDQNAFAQVYEATFRYVYYVAFKILHNEPQAQDIAQEVYITVFQKLGTLQDPGAFMGWLRQIVANKCEGQATKYEVTLYYSRNTNGEASITIVGGFPGWASYNCKIDL